MLAHPKSLIAYIGHADSAMLVGFDDPNNPDLKTLNKQLHPRMAPFTRGVSMLLEGQPVGLAMAYMNEKYNVAMALAYESSKPHQEWNCEGVGYG